MKCLLGGLKTAGGVKAWSELKTNIAGAESFSAAGDALERNQTGPGRRIQPTEPRRNQDAVFSDEGDNIRNRAQGSEIEELANIEFRRVRQIGFAPAFNQRMGELERQAGGAEFAKTVGTC